MIKVLSAARGRVVGGSGDRERLSTRPSRLARLGHAWQGHAFGSFAVLPALVLLGVFLLYPVTQVVYLSTTRWTGLGPIRGNIGLGNYEYLLVAGDFASSIRVNLTYTLVTAPLTVALGFLLAAVIQRRARGWRFFKPTWFLPVLIPGTVTAILWSSAIYAPNVGALDSLLTALGLPTPERGWLGTPNLALAAVIVTATWATTGWPMIVLLAGMERISRDMYEAAMLDGASEVALLRHITFPQLRPVLAAVVTLQIIFGLKVFDLVYVMTGGGPSDYTRVATILMYNLAFTSGQFSRGAAVAVMLLVIITAIALLQRRFLPIDRSD